MAEYTLILRIEFHLHVFYWSTYSCKLRFFKKRMYKPFVVETLQSIFDCNLVNLFKQRKRTEMYNFWAILEWINWICRYNFLLSAGLHYNLKQLTGKLGKQDGINCPCILNFRIKILIRLPVNVTFVIKFQDQVTDFNEWNMYDTHKL